MEQLTKEECELIIKLLENSPLHGTLETLPAVMTKLAALIDKLNRMANEEKP